MFALQGVAAACPEGAAHRTSAAKPSQPTPALVQVLQTGLFLSHLTWRRRHVPQLPRERFGRDCVCASLSMRSLGIWTSSELESDPAESNREVGPGECAELVPGKGDERGLLFRQKSRWTTPSEASNITQKGRAQARRGWIDEKGSEIYSLVSGAEKWPGKAYAKHTSPIPTLVIMSIFAG